MKRKNKIMIASILTSVIFLFLSIFPGCKVTETQTDINENIEDMDISIESSEENIETAPNEQDETNNNTEQTQYEINDITPQEVYDIIMGSEMYFILDVRTQEEYDQGHLEGAHLIPVQELADKLDEVPFNIPVIVYCRSGARSRNAAEILQNNGFPQIYDMGGIIDWQEQGYPVVIDDMDEDLAQADEIEETSEYTALDVDEAFELYGNDDYLFLDVRSKEEYESGHIKGALHIPVYDISDRLDEVPKDKKIIAYCNGSSCGRSDSAAEILIGSGFKDVFDIDGGGIDEWIEKGYPVEK